MNDDMMLLLVSLAVGLVVGIPLGLYVRSKSSWANRWTSYLLKEEKWYYHLAISISLLCVAVIDYVDNSPYYGSFFLLVSIFDISLMLKYSRLVKKKAVGEGVQRIRVEQKGQKKEAHEVESGSESDGK